MAGDSGGKKHAGIPFGIYVVGAFVLTAAMTVLIAASVLVLCWNGSREGVVAGSHAFTDHEIYLAIFLAAIVALFLAMVVGAFFASGIVRPIRRISKTASAIRDGDLTARTDLHGDDELSLLGEAFDEMAESIERDRDLERQLIGDVAHELRTPLMAIQATVEAMQDGVLPANDEQLGTVSSETRRLGRLVEALLHLNRLENGTISANIAPLDLSELVEGLAMGNQALVDSVGLSLEYNVQPDIWVEGDHDLLHQAVSNLLSNAVRYTPEGGTITIRLVLVNGLAQVSVSDTGIGIAPDDLKMVFSRFWRADAARTRTRGGLGIGLALVKEVVDQHRGRIFVTSVLDEGSTFIIELPVLAGSSDKQSSSAQRRAAKAAKKEYEKQLKDQRKNSSKFGLREYTPRGGASTHFGIRVPYTSKKDDDTESKS